MEDPLVRREELVGNVVGVDAKVQRTGGDAVHLLRGDVRREPHDAQHLHPQKASARIALQ